MKHLSPLSHLLPFFSFLLALWTSGCEKPPAAETPKSEEVSGSTQAQPEVTQNLCDDADLTPLSQAQVAEVGETAITGEQLRAAIQNEEESARREYCQQIAELQNAALSGLIEDQLIEKAARSAGFTRAKYLQQHFAKAVKKPSDADLLRFYKKNARDDAPPYEDVKQEIIDLFEEQERSRVRGELLKTLENGTSVRRLLTDVRPPARVFDIPTYAASWGSKDAPVTLVEFSDFECPYCAEAAETIALLKKRYPKRLRIVFWHFPLSFHENAKPAALFSQCASAQGKFWPFHDLIFANQQNMSAADLLKYAEDSGVDMNEFQTCLVRGAAEENVESMISDAEELGVDATPTLLLNGRSASSDFGELTQLIDGLLAGVAK